MNGRSPLRPIAVTKTLSPSVVPGERRITYESLLGKPAAPGALVALGRQGMDLSVSSAAPSSLRLAEAFDANPRELWMEIQGMGDGSDAQSLRIQLADGVTSPFVDLVFPLGLEIVGVLRIVHEPGASMSVSCDWSLGDSAADVPLVSNPPTKAEVDAIVNRINLMKRSHLVHTMPGGVTTTTRVLEFSTLPGSGTASTFNILALREFIAGPPQ